MARLWTCGFEAGVIIPNRCLINQINLDSSLRRTGAYGARANATDAFLRAVLDSDLTELYARVGFYLPYTNGTTTLGIMHFLNSENEDMIQVLFNRSSYGTLSIQRREASSWTELARSSKMLSYNTWHCIELHLKLHDSEGVAQVKVDGSNSLWINYSGDTLGSNTPAVLRSFGVGKSIAGPNNDIAAWQRWDDLAINDTTGDRNNAWCGTGGVYPIKVTGAGDHTGQTASAGDNWTCVDETPPSDTDYVYTDTTDVYDLYACSDPSPDPGTADIVAMTVFARAKLAAAGDSKLATIIKTNSAEKQGTPVTLSTTAEYIATVYDLNPITGEAWTLDEVKALQIGTIAK